MSKPPVIDGVIDTAEWEWASTRAVTVDSNAADGIRGGSAVDRTNLPVDSNDLSFQVFVGYDGESLYVAVRVKDDANQEDSAEAGSRNAKTGEDKPQIETSHGNLVIGGKSYLAPKTVAPTIDGVIQAERKSRSIHSQAYMLSLQGMTSGGSAIMLSPLVWFTMQTQSMSSSTIQPLVGIAATWRTAGGYPVEFKVTKSALSNPQDGSTLGFHIAINDDDGNGTTPRSGSVFPFLRCEAV